MAKKTKRSAINRAVEELATEMEGCVIGKGTAGLMSDRIGVDFISRMIFCSELRYMSIVPDYTPKEDIKAELRRLVKRLRDADNTTLSTGTLL